jgi:hypothetical protein
VSYHGSALVQAGEQARTVRIRLAGHVEPLDGRYHWGGRIEPDAGVVALVHSGQRTVTVRIGLNEPVPGRLGEPDPWGGVRIQGIGRPPFTEEEDPYDN